MPCASRWRWYPQPDMCRLHGGLHHGEQMVAQRIHIDLIAQSSAEGRDCASRIVLTAIETAVDNGLDALTQGLEEARNGEGRGYDNKRRLRELARNQAYQR